MHDFLAAASLTELVTALRTGRLSARELLQGVLERVRETHDDLNALVSRHADDVLLEQADAADARIARGAARSLEGIPLAVKDLEDVAGLVTSNGSKLYADNYAERDSTQVARLRAAGAIPIGKSNTPEFGFTAITKNPLFGVTRNPWDLSRTPGGSSGGSAALLAAGVVPLVTASDGGGSVRIPAAWCGAFGLKPSFGRIPQGPSGEAYFGDTTSWGPLTRTVEDAALMLDQVVGPSEYDPNSLPHPGFSYAELLRNEVTPPLRIAFSPDLGYANVQDDIAALIEASLPVFEKQGHRVEPISGGPSRGLGGVWGRFDAFETAASLHALLDPASPSRADRSAFTHAFLAGLDGAADFDVARFRDVKVLRGELIAWCAELFSEFDMLITPTLPFDPPPARGPFPSETNGRPQLGWGTASFTIPFNFSRHPAATLRAGLSRAGMPVGLQIVGPRHRDEQVLCLARDFERERPWHPQWPIAFGRERDLGGS